MDKSFRSMQQSTKNDNVQAQITQYEKTFLEWLVNMHNTLRKDQIDMAEVEHLADVLNHMKEEDQHDYLESLIRPEISKGCKIPTNIPVPSASFQMHNSITFAPNSAGHAAILFNPFFLSSNSTNYSTLYINNNAALTGNTVSDHFLARDIGQTIPAVYNEYRLVSASVVVRYIGRLDIVQGVIGGAIVFDSNVGSTIVDGTTTNANLAKYGNFNLAQDSYYFQENMTLNGLREIYFPLDTTFEQYRRAGPNQNDPKLGFSFVIYLQDGVYQPNATNYKLDIYCNYECLPDASFLNYVPTNTGSHASDETKNMAVRQAQLNAIGDGEIPRQKGTKKSFWENIKEKVGSYLPKIEAILPYISNVIPGGKIVSSAVSTAGSLFGGSRGGNHTNAESFLKPQLGSVQDWYNSTD